MRLWDRVLDGQVMTPMQNDALRPEASRDEYGVGEARAALDAAYALLDGRVAGAGWVAGDRFSLADCAAAPALHHAYVVHRWDEERLGALTHYFTALISRPSVQRVIEEARGYRELFPLPWPDHVA